MALRGQSFLLWSVLIGLLSVALVVERSDPAKAAPVAPVAAAMAAAGGSVPGCSAGQMKCGSECKDLTTDQQNCGTCGNACGAGQTCQAGQCQCSAGLLACDGTLRASDASHCGSCTTTCAGAQVCSNNSCQGELRHR